MVRRTKDQTRGIKPYEWKPGQSGNPGGRPRKKPISDRYEMLAEILLEEDVRLMLKMPKGSTYGDAAALQQFRAAIKGETSAIKEIREAIEGKSTIRIADVGDEPSDRFQVIDVSAIPRHGPPRPN